MKSCFAALVPLLALSACGTSVANRVAEHSKLYKMKGNSGYAVTYDSRGRGAYVAMVNKVEYDANNNPVGKTLQLKLCAEPAPDASANLDYKTQTRSKVDVGVTYQAIEAAAKVGTENLQAFTSTIADVAQRTELVLVMRDMLYRVCELHLNGVLDEKQTAASFDSVIRVTAHLGQRDTVGKLIGLLANKDAKLDPEAQKTLSNAITGLIGAQLVSGTISDPAMAKDVVDRAVDKLFPKK